MEKKKGVLWFLAGCLAFTVLAIGLLNAQEDGTPSPEASHAEEADEMASDRFLDKLHERLKLTDKQKKSISAILAESRPAMKQRTEKLKALRGQMQALLKELRTQMRDSSERIRAELDNEQREKFDEMKVRARQGMNKRRSPRWMEGQNMPPRSGGGDLPPERSMPPPEMWHDSGSRGGGKPALPAGGPKD